MQGLNCIRKQVEKSEILHKNNIDLLAVQESCLNFQFQVIHGLGSLEVKNHVKI